MTTTTNGQQRKTLADQLDRLDSILDALGAGLNEAVSSVVEQAVRQAVQQAVHEAVQAVLAEVLSNAQLQAALRAAALPPEPAAIAPGPWGGALALAWDGCRRRLGQAATWTAKVAQAGWCLARRYPGRAAATCAAVVAAGVAAWWTGPCLGAAVGWAGGYATGWLVRARDGLRRLLPAADAVS